jgi:predicted transcriptional regulator
MKRWRLAAGLTQREMGEHLEVDGSYVAYLESGKRSPSATVIARYWKIIPRWISTTQLRSRLLAGIWW